MPILDSNIGEADSGTPDQRRSRIASGIAVERGASQYWVPVLRANKLESSAKPAYELEESGFPADPSTGIQNWTSILESSIAARSAAGDSQDGREAMLFN